MVPPAMGPAAQSIGTSTYPVLCFSPWHLDLIPSAVVESEPAAPGVRHVAMAVAAAMATVPVVEAPVSAPASPSLLDL